MAHRRNDGHTRGGVDKSQPGTLQPSRGTGRRVFYWKENVRMVARDDIHQRIVSQLPDADVLIHDLTGGGDHCQVVVVSKAFVGLSAIKRHRLVYDTLRDVLGGALHALALKTLTPDESAPQAPGSPPSLQSVK